MSHTLLMPLGAGLRPSIRQKRGRNVRGRRHTTYYLSDNGEYIGTYTAAEISQRIGCSMKTVVAYASSGTACFKRWTFERAEELDDQWKAEWTAGWEKARQLILKPKV